MLNEGKGYAVGNLTREWERKEATVRGEQTILWKNAIAHQPHKNDETIFVDITVWPYEGDDSLGRTIAESTSKGTASMAYGKLELSHYKKRDGSDGSGWAMNVYKFATQLRPPWTDKPSTGTGAVAKEFPGAKYTEKEMEPF